MQNIFETTDPRGLRVFCTEERWNDHIIDGHPNMSNQENIVKKAIENPQFGIIYQDSKRENRNIYYIHPTGKNYYIKVVVDFTDDVGSVITAFPADSGKSGEIMIWPSSRL